jgi:SAM-dependent methyltransferase
VARLGWFCTSTIGLSFALQGVWSFDILPCFHSKVLCPMNIASSPTPYDDIPYPGGVFPSTRPEHLATLAALYGMRPAEIGHCRVLELGCGFGANLLPMAYHYPDTRFVGVDLSGSSIARGRQNVAALGLANIELHHQDILGVGSEFGEFDYIISHGVYSWVPDVVRDKMLSIFKENLAPQGVCYVSYNAFPFSHSRDMVRDLVLFHTRHISDPRQKIAQARGILRFVSDSARSDTVHGAILREQSDRISQMADEFFFHDDLNESAQAFLLYQVVARAQAHGLQYLSDADFARGNVDRYADECRSVLQSFPDDEMVARNQYQDFIDGFGFRRTLLCHEDVVLQRKVSRDFFSRCYFTSASTLLEDPSDPKAQPEVSLETRDKGVFGISHWMAQAAYLLLSKSWPRAVSFDELFNDIRSNAALGSPAAQDVHEETLVSAMYELVCNDAVSFSLYPREYLKPEDNKLLASSLARHQSQWGTTVVNLLHQTVRLENDDACYILQLLDGARDFDQVVAEVHARHQKTRLESAGVIDGPTDLDMTRTSVHNVLNQVKKLGLMAH